MSTPRAVVVIDDSPQRVTAVLALLQAEEQASPAAVHVVCSSASVADRMVPALQRAVARLSVRAADRKALKHMRGLVTRPFHAHVLGGDDGHVGRDADCCLSAANWLFELIRGIRRGGLPIDAVAGPHAPLRAMLLLSAIERAGSAADRLFLFRGRAHRAPARAGNRNSRNIGKLLLISHVPPSPDELARMAETYGDLVASRLRAWRALSAPDPLVVNVAEGVLKVGTIVVPLTPDQMFWYASFALMPGRIFPHRLFGSALALNGEGQPEVAIAADESAQLRAWLRHLHGVFHCAQPHNHDRFGKLLHNACDLRAPQLGSMLAKIARALHDALGPAAERYCIRAVKGVGYRLDLPADAITVTFPRQQVPRTVA